jgi:hypothetical protein
VAVLYRQIVGGAVTDGPRRIEPLAPRQSDVALLAAKMAGAKGKGWTVKRNGPRSFKATKRRWGGALCVREFWID